MGYDKIDDSQLDIINYLAIISLEELGNLAPTEDEITEMEIYLTASLKRLIYSYSKKFKKYIEKLEEKMA